MCSQLVAEMADFYDGEKTYGGLNKNGKQCLAKWIGL